MPKMSDVIHSHEIEMAVMPARRSVPRAAMPHAGIRSLAHFLIVAALLPAFPLAGFAHAQPTADTARPSRTDAEGDAAGGRVGQDARVDRSAPPADDASPPRQPAPRDNGETDDPEAEKATWGRREALLASLTIFVLAVFVGFEVITKVPPTLHTPLMSGSNAISGITVVGAILAVGVTTSGSPMIRLLGTLAVIMATVNVVGGFAVTHRMLAMFRRK